MPEAPERGTRDLSPARNTVVGVALVALAAAGITAAIYVLEPPRARLAKASTPAKTEPAKPRVESGVVLLAGETLVDAPHPAAVPAEQPAQQQLDKPVAKPRTKQRHAPTPPKYAKPPPPHIAANTPQYNGEERRPRGSRGACVTCARVVGISEYPTYWEVRVRFRDGSRDALSYADRPPFEIGDTVRMEHGRLYHD